MIARAVIGANYGDEGKGLVTDWLCSQGAGVVVRFNGGAQAGHTVVTPQGERHVFSHFGSGTFLGVPTYLSQFFVVNPILFFKEMETLEKLGLNPTVYAHPGCLVTTFADMVINQRREDKKGNDRHGSVGVGFGETIGRSDIVKITMGDLWNNPRSLEPKLVELCDKYARWRTGEKIDNAEKLIQAFLTGCHALAETLVPLGIQQCPDPVFEGAQGLLLDMDHKNFPHVTRSKTGIANVRTLAAMAGIDKVEPYYVSRTYLTKHGAGPLPDYDPKLKYHDDTNVSHPYQGTIRYAPLDYRALRDRCREDIASDSYQLVLTHCDQHMEKKWDADWYFYGPTRMDVTSVKKEAA